MTEVKEKIEAGMLHRLIEQNDKVALNELFEKMNIREMIYALDHLGRADRQRLFQLLETETAADVLEEIHEEQARKIISNMAAENAALIIQEMESDDQADLISELNTTEAEAILSKMDEEDAAHIRELILYDENTAGGLMVTEFIEVDSNRSVSGTITYLRENKEEFADFHIRYVYVSDAQGVFLGVVQMQDMLLAPSDQPLTQLVKKAISVHEHDDLQTLVDFFDKYDFIGAPVTNSAEEIVGVVLRRNVLEANAERIAMEHLETQGIVGGDELRSMPVWLRARRRLSWLSVNVLLNIIAASVIAFHQDTLSSVIALAVFLPIISDMSGCSGNQAVAVSMRELSIGTVRPNEVLRVWWQEVSVGLINGLALGALIGLAAYLWKGNIYLGLVAGGALAINTVVAVSIGGTVPLLLKGFNIDPALASGPILTTITDMIGFFLALTFATMMLDKLM